jgi:glutamyl-tRNA reductase
MKFIVYGLNHITAPIEIREKFALSDSDILEFFKKIKNKTSDIVFLSTCNRVEFYFLSFKNEKEIIKELINYLNQFYSLKDSDIKKYFYYHEGEAAYLHLFRVASSLDSMVIGEPQILGQVRSAYQQAVNANMVGSILNNIFLRAFVAAKKVRTQTEISRMPISISSIVVDLSKRIFSSLQEKQVLLFGAGEMGELTAKYLSLEGVKNLWIANRTYEIANSLAKSLNGFPLTLEEGLRKIGSIDIIVTSILNEKPFLTLEKIKALFLKRDFKPLFIIDIGVPRNVDSMVGKLASVYLYNIDDLASIAKINHGMRQKWIVVAEEILNLEIKKLNVWINNLQLVPTIKSFFKKFDDIRAMEVSKFIKKNNEFSEKEINKIDHLTQNIIAKLLHSPTVNLKTIETESKKEKYMEILSDIFNLNYEIKNNTHDEPQDEQQ